MNLMVIFLANKQYKLLSLIIIIQYLYTSVDNIWSCLGSIPSGTILNTLQNIAGALLVYIFFIININAQYTRFIPLLTVLIVFLTDIYRGTMGKMVGYFCI